MNEDLVEFLLLAGFLAAAFAVNWYRRRRSEELEAEASEPLGRFGALELGLATGPSGRRYATLGFSVTGEEGPETVEILLDSRQGERLARLLRKAAA